MKITIYFINQELNFDDINYLKIKSANDSLGILNNHESGIINLESSYISFAKHIFFCSIGFCIIKNNHCTLFFKEKNQIS